MSEDTAEEERDTIVELDKEDLPVGDDIMLACVFINPEHKEVSRIIHEPDAVDVADLALMSEELDWLRNTHQQMYRETMQQVTESDQSDDTQQDLMGYQ